jgi:hypothetical protein
LLKSRRLYTPVWKNAVFALVYLGLGVLVSWRTPWLVVVPGAAGALAAAAVADFEHRF